MEAFRSFRTNVIVRAELTRFERENGQRTWIVRGARLLLQGTLAGWIGFALYTVLMAILKPATLRVWEDLTVPVVLLSVVTLIAHFAILFRILTVASESIMREKRCGTWETLLLTGVNARQVVLGKWWAATRVSWRETALLATLRAGAVVGLGTTLNLVYGPALRNYPQPPIYIPHVGNIALAMLLVAGLTLANSLFTAAAGVVGGLLTSRRDGVATPLAQVVRMAALLAPMITLIALGLYLTYAPGGPHLGEGALKGALVFVLVLLDNGMLLGAALINPYDGDVLTYGLVALAGIAFYGALALALLAAGEYIGRRQGLLAPDTAK